VRCGAVRALGGLARQRAAHLVVARTSSQMLNALENVGLENVGLDNVGLENVGLQIVGNVPENGRDLWPK
jgi:hypothetical protein